MLKVYGVYNGTPVLCMDEYGVARVATTEVNTTETDYIYNPPLDACELSEHLRGGFLRPMWNDQLWDMYLHPNGTRVCVRSEDLTSEHVVGEGTFMSEPSEMICDRDYARMWIVDDDGSKVVFAMPGGRGQLPSKIELAPKCRKKGCSVYVFGGTDRCFWHMGGANRGSTHHRVQSVFVYQPKVTSSIIQEYLRGHYMTRSGADGEWPVRFVGYGVSAYVRLEDIRRELV